MQVYARTCTHTHTHTHTHVHACMHMPIHTVLIISTHYILTHYSIMHRLFIQYSTYVTCNTMLLCTFFILLSVQTAATFLAILVTSSLSFTIILAVMINFFDWTPPSSPLQCKLLLLHYITRIYNMRKYNMHYAVMCHNNFKFISLYVGILL